LNTNVLFQVRVLDISDFSFVGIWGANVQAT
jgi:hypothetical protein